MTHHQAVFTLSVTFAGSLRRNDPSSKIFSLQTAGYEYPRSIHNDNLPLLPAITPSHNPRHDSPPGNNQPYLSVTVPGIGFPS
jgi:hypothetical protein